MMIIIIQQKLLNIDLYSLPTTRLYPTTIVLAIKHLDLKHLPKINKLYFVSKDEPKIYSVIHVFNSSFDNYDIVFNCANEIEVFFTYRNILQNDKEEDIINVKIFKGKDYNNGFGGILNLNPKSSDNTDDLQIDLYYD